MKEQLRKQNVFRTTNLIVYLVYILFTTTCGGNNDGDSSEPNHDETGEKTVIRDAEIVDADVAEPNHSEVDVSEPNHGVADDKKVNELSQQELDSICDDANKRRIALFNSADTNETYRENYQIRYCTGAGLIIGSTKTQCETTKEQCLQMTNGLADVGFRVDAGLITPMCPDREEMANCDISISDIDNCTQEQIVAAQQMIDQPESMANTFSCDDAGKLNESESIVAVMIGIAEQPAVCKSLQNSCPNAVLYFVML